MLNKKQHTEISKVFLSYLLFFLQAKVTFSLEFEIVLVGNGVGVDLEKK